MCCGHSSDVWYQSSEGIFRILVIENALSVVNNVKLDFDKYFIWIRETRRDISGRSQSPREEVRLIEVRHCLCLEKSRCFALCCECFQTNRNKSNFEKIDLFHCLHYHILPLAVVRHHVDLNCPVRGACLFKIKW